MICLLQFWRQIPSNESLPILTKETTRQDICNQSNHPRYLQSLKYTRFCDKLAERKVGVANAEQTQLNKPTSWHGFCRDDLPLKRKTKFSTKMVAMVQTVDLPWISRLRTLAFFNKYKTASHKCEKHLRIIAIKRVQWWLTLNYPSIMVVGIGQANLHRMIRWRYVRNADRFLGKAIHR